MEQNERLNALKIALQNEEREREFYLLHEKKTNNSLGKAMFREIANDELEHYKRLQELYSVWEKEGKWPESIPLNVKNTNVKEVLRDALEKTAKLPPGDDDDLTAVRTAIEFESRGVRYYSELRDSVANPIEKDFFNLLAMIENEHFLSLKDTEEFLTDPASWYRKKERHTLDGA
ncbi:MAG: ferritin family protein [Syntrophales bacterium]|nr:ferritin family protein [Syntrophales bacterium]MDY0044486.1 ferritin family protein [Syntrophales bacterium]